MVGIIPLIGCEILPFERLNPSERFGKEKLSAHPIRSLIEVNEFFVETEKVNDRIKDKTISFDNDLVFMDVHGSGKTSLLAYLSKRARDSGYNPFWVELPEVAMVVDLQKSVEQAFVQYGPQKPILVIDAAEKCPSVISSISALKRGMYYDLPIWLSIASEDMEPLQEDLNVLERDCEFLRLPLPGILSYKDINLFIERISSETTPEVCEYLRTWAKEENASPGLMLEAYRVIIEGKRKGVGEKGLQREISSIASDSKELYENLFNHGLDQHMREVITYVAALGEVDRDLLSGMIAKRGLDEDGDLIDILDIEKRRLFVKEKRSEFEDKSLRLVYLHDGLRRVALSRGNFDAHKAKEIAKILVNLSNDPILGGKACLAFLNLYINFNSRFRLLTRDTRDNLSSTLLSSQPDPRKYFVVAVLVNEFPELITLWRSALANSGDTKVWADILDRFGVHVGNIMRMHKEARGLFEKSLSINHGHLQSLIHLALAYISLGDRNSVLTAFDSAPNELKETNEYLKARADILLVLNREDEARELLESLLEEEPKNVELLTNLSVYYSRKNDLEKAKELLLRVVKSEPRNPGTIARLIELELQRQGHEPLPAEEQERAQATLSAIDKLLEELQDNPMLLKERGNQLWNSNREEEARELWESLLEEEPNNAELLTNLSVYYSRKNDLEKAKELLLRAVKSEPRNPGTIARLIELELQRQGHEPLPAEEQERAQATLSAIDKLLEELQDNPMLLKERGNQLWNSNREEEARELWESLLEEEPNNAELLTNLSVYYIRKNDLEKAKELLLRAVKSEPRNPGTIARLIELELRRQGHEPLPAEDQERAQATLSAIDKLLEELPDNPMLRKERGVHLGNLNREEEARELWESLLEEEPKNVELLTNLSVYYSRKNDLEKAKELLLRAVKSEPRNPGTIARLIELELRRQGHEPLPAEDQERAQATLSAIDKLLEELQDNPMLRKERGVHLGNLNREEEARELWESLLEEEPKNVELLTNLSVYYSRKNDLEKAKELLLRAVKSEPRNQETIGRLIELELRRQGHEPLPAEEQERAQATLSAIDKLLEELQDNPMLRKERGNQLWNSNREEEARELWESLLEEEPKNVELLTNLSVYYSRKNDLEKAKELLLRAVKSEPRNPGTTARLIKLELRRQGHEPLPAEDQERAQATLSAIDKLLEELQDNPMLRKERGNQLWNSNREEEARELWESLLEEEPKNVELLTNLSVYYSRKNDLEKAKELLLRAVKSEPRNPGTIARLIELELRRQGHEPLPAEDQERAQATLSAIDKLLEELQDNPLLRKERGNQLWNSNREEEARELWESLLEEEPKNVELLTNLSVYYSRKNDLEKAKELLLRAVKSEPRNQETIGRLIELELRRQGHEPLPAEDQERAQATLSAIDKLLEELPDNPMLRKERGGHLGNLNREEEARELWESLLEEEPKNVELLTNLSVYYSRKNDLEKAKELLLRAVKSEPRNPGTIARLIELELRRQGHEPLPAEDQERAQATLSAIDKLLEELQDNPMLRKERGNQLWNSNREEEARELWESLLEEEPKNVELLTNLSVYYSRKNDLEKAKELLLRAVKSEPRNQETIARLIELELRRQGHEPLPAEDQERAQATLSAIDKLLEELPDNPLLRKERGGHLGNLNREEEARELWESLLEEEPKNVELLTNLSVYYIWKNDLEKAKELLLRAVKSEPRNQETIGRLIELELRRQGHEPLPAEDQERAQATLSAIDKLLEELQDNPLLRKERGNQLWNSNREEEARELWESLLEEEPKNVELLTNLSVYYSRKNDLEKAKELLLRAVKSEPRNQETIARLIELELRRQGHEPLPAEDQERAQATLSAIDKLLEELQDNPLLRKERGNQLWNSNREEEARELWESLLEEEPNNAELLTNLSVYYIWKNDLEKAKELLLRAVKSEPRNPGTTARLIKLELRRQGHEPLPAEDQERAQATLSAIDKLLEELQDNPLLRKWRGDHLAILDREEEARELWKSLLEVEPNNVGVLETLTKNLMKNRQFSDAVPFAERCLKLQPRDENIIGLVIIAYTNTFTGESRSSKISPLLVRIDRDSDKPRDLYNLACGYAQLGNKEDMLWALRVTKSFDERKLSIARADPDFDDFKDDPDFLEVVI